MSMRVECRNCDTFLLSDHRGGFAHHRNTNSCDKPEPDFPEDPALAGLPVQWVWEDGALRRATPADQPEAPARAGAYGQPVLVTDESEPYTALELGGVSVFMYAGSDGVPVVEVDTPDYSTPRIYLNDGGPLRL